MTTIRDVNVQIPITVTPTNSDAGSYNLFVENGQILALSDPSGTISRLNAPNLANNNFTGSVGIGGNLTIGGNVNITGSVMQSTAVGVRVFNSADINLSGSVNNIVTFNSERFDSHNFHSLTGTGLTSRLTVPAGLAGLYHIGACVSFASNVTGTRGVFLQLNGSILIAVIQVPTVTTGHNSGVVISTIYNLAVGDYVEVIAWQNTPATILLKALTNYSPEFWMHRIT